MVNIPGIKPKQHHIHIVDATDCPDICRIKKIINNLKDSNCIIDIINALLHSNRKIRITALKRLLYLKYEIIYFETNEEPSFNNKEINEAPCIINNIISEDKESIINKEVNKSQSITSNMTLETNEEYLNKNNETDFNKYLLNEFQINNIIFYMLDDPCHFIREISLENIKFDLNFKKTNNKISNTSKEMLKIDKRISKTNNEILIKGSEMLKTNSDENKIFDSNLKKLLKTTFSNNELLNKILALSYDNNTNIRLISIKKLSEGSFFVKNFNSKIFLRFCSLFTDTSVNVRKKVSKYMRKIQITNRNDITNILNKQPPNDKIIKDMKFYNTNGAIIHGLEDENTEVRLNTIKALYNFTLDLDLTTKIFYLILDMLNDDIEEVRRVSSYILVLISKKYKLIFNFQDLKILQGCLNEKCCIIRGNVFRVISHLQYNEGCLDAMEFIIKGINEFGVEIINCKNIDKIGNEIENIVNGDITSELISIKQTNETNKNNKIDKNCKFNETNKNNKIIKNCKSNEINTNNEIIKNCKFNEINRTEINNEINRENYNLLFDCLKNFVKNNFDFIKENINNVFDFKNNIYREMCLEDKEYLGRLCIIYYLNLESKIDILWYMKNHFRYLEILKFKYEICYEKNENKIFYDEINIKVYSLLIKRFIFIIKNIEYFYRMNKGIEEDELTDINGNKFDNENIKFIDKEKECIDEEKGFINEETIDENKFIKEELIKEKESIIETESIDRGTESIKETKSIDRETESLIETESIDRETESIDREKESIDREKESIDRETETINRKINKKYLTETSDLIKICKNRFIKSVWKYLLSYINGDKNKIKLFFFKYKIYELNCNFCILKNSEFFKKLSEILQNKEKFKIEKIKFGVNVVDTLSVWKNLPINFYVFCFYTEITPNIKVRIGYDNLFIYLDVEPIVHVTLFVACEYVSVCLVVRFKEDFVLSDIKFIKISYL
ncbi:hypothetical protein CWI39_0290p0010 [Hamiltosporidium magnivora]|uniref:Condensin complex subunit 1 C-terminal domain-containing protein n=1 Tax=Hamiltosporidium magnivora TaxID=148818 RepID=A0A4Q9LHN2_9MICR|nr:hypothetical protein CWI39_0290p0010 [Hamiltosporidium magnivora]